jgi:hypothetical protein
MHYFFILLGFFIPSTAFAAITPPSIRPPTSVGILSGNGNAIISLACTGLNYLFTFALILSIVFALLAAFDYLTSAGDPAKIKKAGNRLIYTAIGVAVALFARTLPVLVGTIVGVSNTSTDTSSLCPSS